MPLVVPGLQSKDGKGEDWTSKLMGKSLGDAHNETVSPAPPLPSQPHPPLAARCPLYPFHCSCQTCLAIPQQCPTKIRDSRVLTTGQTFAKQDLPKEHRVLEPGSMKTMDFKPDRLNIHVGEDGTVQNVKFG